MSPHGHCSRPWPERAPIRRLQGGFALLRHGWMGTLQERTEGAASTRDVVVEAGRRLTRFRAFTARSALHSRVTAMQALHRTTILAAVLALLVGPQWCCCSIRAFVGPRPAASSCCPCCCGESADTRSVDGDRGDEHDGDRGGHQCPCRGKQRSIAAASGKATPRTLVPSVPVPVGIAVMPPPREIVAVGQIRSSGWPLPLAGRSLLSMLGVLRC